MARHHSSRRRDRGLAGSTHSAERLAPSRIIALVVLAVATLALLAVSPRAGAQLREGHTFAGTFGSPGAGEGQLSSPSDVAVDEASGLVYVSDTGGERVEIFKRTGDAQYSYVSSFKVRDPGPVAVDNSSSPSDPSRGEVYIAGAGHSEEAEENERDTLFVYSPTEGAVVQRIHSFKYKEKGGEKLEEESEFEAGISGLDVDASGTLWVYWEEEGLIDGFIKAASAKGKAQLEWRPALRHDTEERFGCHARSPFAAAPGGDAFYVGYERRNSSGECPGEAEEAPDPAVVAKLDGAAPTPATLIAEIDRSNTTGAAVDYSDGDLYLDSAGSIAEYTSEGVLAQRFGAGQSTGGAGLALDSLHGEVLVVDAAAGDIAVFGPENNPREPAIDGASADDLAPRAAEVKAQIDPGGLSGEYHVEYGLGECGGGATCVSLPAGSLPAAFGDQPVTARLESLAPATTYHYRIIAHNSLGTVAASGTFTTLPSPGVMPDGRGWELVSPAEKHGSTIEMASLLRGGGIQASLDGNKLAWLAAGPVVSEPEGNRSFELSQLMSIRGASGWETQSLETPHTRGWGLLLPSPSEYHFFSPDLSRSLVEPTEYDLGKTEGVVEHPALSPLATEKTMYLRDLPGSTFLPLVTATNDDAGTKFGGALDFLGATSDLSHVVFHSKVGLTTAAPTAAGIYMWQEQAPLQLVSVLPSGEPATDAGFVEPSLGASESLNARGAISDDGARVFWTDGEGRSLYMRDVALGHTIELNSAQGHGAIEAGPGGQEVPEPPSGESGREVRFQFATADGTKVFFTDTARLTEDSGQEPSGEESPADLYEFELTGTTPLRGRLTDITAAASSTSGDVLNLVPGVSDDGSIVYFVANAALAPGATPGRCPRDAEGGEAAGPGSTCNLYVSEADPAHPGQRTVRFIASLSSEDAADWGASATSKLSPSALNISAVTSRVSPDGRYIVFMSQRSLTGYANADSSTGQPDEEVFLFDAASGSLTCTSCNPREEDGGWVRPHGVFDTELAGEGVGLLVDRPEIWHEHNLAGSLPGWSFNINGKAQPAALYQPRFLSNSGRLFFNSADGLAPEDRNDKEDVYEYEPEGVGSCLQSGGCTGLISSGTSSRESAFLDASEDGDDVFFLTAAPLVGADKDQSLDIYDAHVCTQAEPCFQQATSSSPECESATSCRPGGNESPSPESAPPSTTVNGPGNTVHVLSFKSTSPPSGKAKPLTRAQKLARALRSCRKQHRHSKKKRAACERLARKKYGAGRQNGKKAHR